MYHLDRTLFRRSTPHSGPQVVGILNLIWSLRAAGCTEATTQDMMKFCVSLLLKIGRSTGNNLAMAMAKTVRESWMEKHGQRKQMALLLSQ